MVDNKYNTYQFGYFLKEEFVKKAIQLIDDQLKVNKPVYKTLNFEYIRESKSDIDVNKEILNNFFFGIKSKYFCKNYTIGKGILGYRKFNFLSYGMLVVYYAIGLYIKHITTSLYEEKQRISKNVQSFYGTRIVDDFYENSGTIANVYYLEGKGSYKEFLNKMEQSVSEGDYIIELDIKDYFDNLDIDILLDICLHTAKPSIKKSFNYDENTIEVIRIFLKYLSQDGIIQSDNNIISSFLGDLYLSKLDLFIYKYLNTLIGTDNYFVLRYVDDIKIIIKGYSELRIDIFSILKDFEEFLQIKCNLQLNTKKTTLKLINNKTDIEELIFKLLPSLSEEEMNPQVFNPDLDIDSRLEAILSSLLNIKETNIQDFSSINPDDINNIKSIFKDSRILTKFKSTDYRERLKSIFKDFNFNYTLFYYKGFHALMVINNESINDYLDYFLGKEKIHLYDLKAIEHFLLQDLSCSDMVIIDKLNILFGNFKEYFKEQGINTEDNETDFYLRNLDSSFISDKYIEQIKLRNIAEKKNDYSSALNHLLNEIHQLIYDSELVYKKGGDYKSEDCIKRLYGMNIDPAYIIIVKNLFDRRNNNPLSHSGLDGNIAWSVKESEYFGYRKNILTLENIILGSL